MRLKLFSSATKPGREDDIAGSADPSLEKERKGAEASMAASERSGIRDPRDTVPQGDTKKPKRVKVCNGKANSVCILAETGATAPNRAGLRTGGKLPGLRKSSTSGLEPQRDRPHAKTDDSKRVDACEGNEEPMLEN